MENDLNFDEDYETYNEFYHGNQMSIYKKIVDIYEHMKDNNLEVAILKLKANIGNFYWNSDILFEYKDINVLNEHILEFFEDNEEYEYCQKIKDLIKPITDM